MKTQVRILFALAAVALLAGWLGLRRGNAALEAKVVDDGARRAQAQPDEAGPDHRAPQQEVSR